MSEFRTRVNTTGQEQKLNYSSPVILAGSCFSQNIGEKLNDFYFPALINPFGILYNPLSIHTSLLAVAEKRCYNEDKLIHYNGRWQSMDHHGSFSDKEKSTCLLRINSDIEQAHEFFCRSKMLVLTFGTAWVYELKSTQQTVGNCHKFPAGQFNKRLLTVNEIVGRYESFFAILKKIHPDLHICFTVSPVRHWKDGVRENSISKSILHIAVHQLISNCKNTSYFPSYEIMMDDLRDYRFYEKDMLHPTQVAIDYIWDQFIKVHFSDETLRGMEMVEKINAAKNHRPFDPSSESHQQFLRKQLLLIEEMEEKFPEIDMSGAKSCFSDQVF